MSLLFPSVVALNEWSSFHNSMSTFEFLTTVVVSAVNDVAVTAVVV